MAKVSFGGYEFLRKANPGLGYMIRKEPQRYITEDYVCTPPALTITDETGAIWCLGFNTELSRGEFAYDVVRNGVPVGEKANRIERRAGKISIFGPEGRKNWNGRSFV